MTSLQLFKYLHLLGNWKFNILLYRLTCLRHLSKQKIFFLSFCYSKNAAIKKSNRVKWLLNNAIYN